MYNKVLLVIFSLIICSCTTHVINNKASQKLITENKVKKNYISESKTLNNITDENSLIFNEVTHEKPKTINNTIHVVLPDNEKYKYISESFVKSLEIAVFDLKNESLNFQFSFYKNTNDLENIFNQSFENQQTFIGPLTSEDTRFIKKFCQKNILIFSFASDRKLAGECLFLFNFFIEDDLRAIFNFLDTNSRVALLYPNNIYGEYVNFVVDDIARNSRSTLIYKLSYEEDLSNIRSVIKQLGKYDYRKEELNRQINLLKQRDDEISLASLKKLEKFETIGELDFTHLIISDGNLRILELAPLLPFYDIDPDKIKFIGTGLWDEKSFFDEPSLQGAIFPGIEEKNRKNFINTFNLLYHIPPPRTATVMYDLAFLINHLFNNNDNIQQIKIFLNNNNFIGLDGKFSIENNIVKREFSILEIKDGKAHLIKN